MGTDLIFFAAIFFVFLVNNVFAALLNYLLLCTSKCFYARGK